MADERETWYLPHPSGEGTLVLNAHPRGWCAGQGCAIHGPTDHWARGMPMTWRAPERQGQPGRMLRTCPHGNDHEDPDDQAFRKSREGYAPARDEACACRCCDGLCDWMPPF